MAAYSVSQGDLENYFFSMIKYAVHYRTMDVVNLLEANGIQVPANVDSKTLHAMVLTAMISSKPFKEGMTELLHNIAMERVSCGAPTYSSVDGGWANQTGCLVTCASSPSTIDALLTASIGAGTAYLLKGNTNSNIKSAVATPAGESSTFDTVMITGLVLAASSLVIWLIVRKKKSKIEIIKEK